MLLMFNARASEPAAPWLPLFVNSGALERRTFFSPRTGYCAALLAISSGYCCCQQQQLFHLFVISRSRRGFKDTVFSSLFDNRSSTNRLINEQPLV